MTKERSFPWYTGIAPEIFHKMLAEIECLAWESKLSSPPMNFNNWSMRDIHTSLVELYIENGWL